MPENSPIDGTLSGPDSAELREELETASRVIAWILASRIWRVTTRLRKLKHKARSMRGSGVDMLVISPTPGETVERHLDLRVQVISRSKITRIEVFLDYILVADLPPGSPGKFQSSGILEYSLHSSVPVASAFAGDRTLSVRSQNSTGAIVELEQEVTIKAGRRTSSDLRVSEIELQTFKRSADRQAGIDLTALLVSDARIRVPRPDRPKVSIVLVTHNRAELTLRCLLSIASHDFDDVEVIVIDNLSTDKTAELLSRVDGAHVVMNDSNLHFLKACNQAADLARGEYLLLLNNDAQLKPGAIRSAVKVLDEDPTVGAVGARIILPNATLQEAGGMIRSNGRTALYGRGDDPTKLKYRFRRDVDYCSGAFLLTRRDLFVELGKFDEAFAPAYYEETDYCVRLWEKGLRVVYEPKCVIEHYEFGSSKKTGSSDALINKNIVKFRAKHPDWLKKQLSDSADNDLVASSRLRPGAKRVLLLESELPRKSRGSGYPRIVEVIHLLSGLGHRLTVMPVQDPLPPHVEFYSELPPEVEIVDGGPGDHLTQLLRERRGFFDVLWISRPENMAVVRKLYDKEPALFRGLKLIYDSEAIYSLREALERKLSSRNGDPADDLESLKAEIGCASICSDIIALSAGEADAFRTHSNARVHVPNYPVKTKPGEPRFDDRFGLLFVGALHTDHSPNVDSMRWFLRQAWPKLRDHSKDMTLTIIGEVDPDIDRELRQPGVIVKGTVGDLNPYYDSARIVIAPTRFAAGTPNKVIEAAANGVPVVATALLAEQLCWTDELLIADEPNFAETCIRLHSDQDLWRSTREKALERIRKEFDPKTIAANLQALVQDAAQAIST
jgi:GT2 family glycosyltransferase